MAISKKAKRRLLKLAAFLRTVPRKRFDYNVWVGDDWRGAKDLSCGTTACALGWATTMPMFRRLGLRMVKSPFFSSVALGDNMDSIGAAMNVFDLCQEDATVLFVPQLEEEYSATPKYVARKIERFVAKNS